MTDQTATDSTATLTGTTPFLVTKGFYENMPQMPVEEYPGTEGYIDDVYADPSGSSLWAGYFRLNHTEAPLDYLYTYNEMKVVLEGTFKLHNPATGQTEYAGPRDAIFFPKGSRIIFSTEDEYALAYYVRCEDLPA
ncbi:Ethanolamine utilization protein EutQ [Corynebacterium provencense]|uniref:Ethanolamine utilization protein EutQ n=2 Tax=Corynebacteriaceae TaxID=1653 RepID=A0A2Z3YPK1_9CORY|nr:Ethanolamine utilization protein EutQ [Corynebacterium provencense]